MPPLPKRAGGRGRVWIVATPSPSSGRKIVGYGTVSVLGIVVNAAEILGRGKWPDPVVLGQPDVPLAQLDSRGDILGTSG
jgi:hypothetical protein